MRKYRITVCLLFLVIVTYSAYIVYNGICSERTLKTDLIELSKIKYGIFSIDEWKLILADIITRKIEEFDLQEEDRGVMRSKIESFLWEAVNQIEEAFEQENTRTSFSEDPFEWASQQIRGGVSAFVDVFGTIRREIPNITDNVLNFLDKEENRENLQRFILKQINAYADKTFSETDYTLHNQITEQYGGGDRLIANAELESAIEMQNERMTPYLYALIAVFVLSVLFIMLTKNLSSVEIVLLSLTGLVLLILGLILPMIEIDARIEQFNFQLLGEPVSFSDQVLYYKSKSINEIVKLLLAQGKPEVFAVGLLVLTFSVVFPFAKLLATMVYCLTASLQRSKFLQFFIFKTGKWSMADVLVVAIFMAYIGFDGIISDQLNQLEGVSRGFDIFTTNQSTLQLGFFFFTGFVLLSLLISHRMQYWTEKDSPNMG